MSKTKEALYAVIGPLDFDKLFYSDPDSRVLPCGNQTVKSQVKESLATLFQDDVKDLNYIASCECGALVGNYYEGVRCEKCKVVVKTNFAEQLKFRAWLELPEFVPPILNPAIFPVLDKWLGSRTGQFSLLETLLNVDADLPPALQGVMGQGFKYFYENFDNIINFFLNDYPPLRQAAAKKRSVGIREYIDMYRNVVFVRHIPVLNQALHLLTSSGTMQYSDECAMYILKAKTELSSMIFVHQNGPTGPRFIDQRMFSFYKSCVDYANSILDIKILGKNGQIRKSILGARLHCSQRSVIVPIVGIHDPDELHIPWINGVILYKLEIINILMNRMGYTMPDALTKHASALAGYDQDISNILDILLEECKQHTGLSGLPTTFGRNPYHCVGLLSRNTLEANII